MYINVWNLYNISTYVLLQKEQKNISDKYLKV